MTRKQRLVLVWGPAAGALVAGAGVALLRPGGWVGYGVALVLMVGTMLGWTIAAHRMKLKQQDPRTQAEAAVGLAGAFAVLLLAGAFWPGHMSGIRTPMAFFVVSGGIQVVYFALRTYRVGESLHCPKCDYEAGSVESAPLVCPECATAWQGRWVKGARRRSTGLAVAGAGLCLFGLLPLAIRFTGMGGAAMSVLPTSVLIATTATDAWGHNKAAWGEVAKRTLSQEEKDTLAGRLLDLRLGTGYLYGPPATWMEAEAGSGGLSAPLVKRYFEEWFEPEIDLPDEVPLGVGREVFVLGEERRGGPNTWMFVWEGPVRVDGVELAPAAGNGPAGGWVHSLSLKRGGIPGGMPMPVPAMPVWVPTGAGDHVIEAEVCVCVVPTGTMPPALVDAEGAPVRPAKTVYFEPRLLRKTVRVVPAE